MSWSSDPQLRPLRRRYEMPFLLLCGLGFSAFFAVVGSLAFSILLIASVFPAGSYTVDGQPATRSEFYAASWPILVTFPFAIAFVGTIAYMLWREDPRSRPLMVGYWVISLAVMIGLAIGDGTAEAWAAVASAALVLLIAWAYLYRKTNVVGYYRVLQRDGTEGSR